MYTRNNLSIVSVSQKWLCKLQGSKMRKWEILNSIHHRSPAVHLRAKTESSNCLHCFSLPSQVQMHSCRVTLSHYVQLLLIFCFNTENFDIQFQNDSIYLVPST